MRSHLPDSGLQGHRASGSVEDRSPAAGPRAPQRAALASCIACSSVESTVPERRRRRRVRTHLDAVLVRAGGLTRAWTKDGSEARIFDRDIKCSKLAPGVMPRLAAIKCKDQPSTGVEPARAYVGNCQASQPPSRARPWRR